MDYRPDAGSVEPAISACLILSQSAVMRYYSSFPRLRSTPRKKPVLRQLIGSISQFMKK